jgi:hypothetical protein
VKENMGEVQVVEMRSRDDLQGRMCLANSCCENNYLESARGGREEMENKEHKSGTGGLRGLFEMVRRETRDGSERINNTPKSLRSTQR